jgi:hypothetical protein
LEVPKVRLIIISQFGPRHHYFFLHFILHSGMITVNSVLSDAMPFSASRTRDCPQPALEMSEKNNKKPLKKTKMVN